MGVGRGYVAGVCSSTGELNRSFNYRRYPFHYPHYYFIGHVRWPSDLENSVIMYSGPYRRALGLVDHRMLYSGGLESVVGVVEEYAYLPSTSAKAKDIPY